MFYLQEKKDVSYGIFFFFLKKTTIVVLAFL